MSLSIIIPTCGRETLDRTIASVCSQMYLMDEIIVCGDGPQPRSEEIFNIYNIPQGHYDETETATHNFGNDQRDLAMRWATRDRLVFMDDDDEFAPNALHTIRKWDKRYPDKILVFQMLWVDRKRVLWEKPIMVAGNIGTPMFVPLNKKDKLSTWGPAKHYGSDFDFMARTVEMQGEPVFVPEVIALIHHVP